MNNNPSPQEELIASAKEYLDMRIDEAKLKFSADAAVITARIISYLIISLLLFIALLFLSVLFYSWMANILDSNFHAILLTASIYLVAAIFVFIFRNKLLVNSLLRMYLKLLFNNTNNER